MNDSNEVRAQILEMRGYVQRRILIASAIVFVLNTVIFWQFSQPHTPPPLVDIVEMTAAQTRLCPGDTLAYSYTLRAREAAITEESVATLRTAPDVAQYEGMVVRRTFPQALDLVERGAWQVPADALPGSYVQLVAVTAPGRVMQPAFGTLAFTVEECEK